MTSNTWLQLFLQVSARPCPPRVEFPPSRRSSSPSLFCHSPPHDLDVSGSSVAELVTGTRVIDIEDSDKDENSNQDKQCTDATIVDSDATKACYDATKALSDASSIKSALSDASSIKSARRSLGSALHSAVCKENNARAANSGSSDDSVDYDTDSSDEAEVEEKKLRLDEAPPVEDFVLVPRFSPHDYLQVSQVHLSLITFLNMTMAQNWSQKVDGVKFCMSWNSGPKLVQFKKELSKMIN